MAAWGPCQYGLKTYYAEWLPCNSVEYDAVWVLSTSNYWIIVAP
jgi:hypothetical protein